MAQSIEVDFSLVPHPFGGWSLHRQILSSLGPGFSGYLEDLDFTKRVVSQIRPESGTPNPNPLAKPHSHGKTSL